MNRTLKGAEVVKIEDVDDIDTWIDGWNCAVRTIIGILPEKGGQNGKAS